MGDNLMNNFFSITINTYNHEDWIENCLLSCLEQDYDNFEVIVIDDISTDRTFEICQQVQKRFPERLRAIQNEEKIYSQVRNILELTKISKERSIVISIDGDDCLKHNRVLNKLNSVYNSGEVWMTYGRYEEYPYNDVSASYYEYPRNVVEGNLFREYRWMASHLRTYRRELFLKIKEEDFKLPDGEWLDVTGDQAFMLPMLEMSKERSRFIPDILYVYNVANPTRDGATKVQRQEEVARYIRSKEKYTRLESLNER
jgi:glycosyltransferase involved in cell wall biosynthesis